MALWGSLEADELPGDNDDDIPRADFPDPFMKLLNSAIDDSVYPLPNMNTLGCYSAQRVQSRLCSGIIGASTYLFSLYRFSCIATVRGGSETMWNQDKDTELWAPMSLDKWRDMIMKKLNDEVRYHARFLRSRMGDSYDANTSAEWGKCLDDVNKAMVYLSSDTAAELLSKTTHAILMADAEMRMRHLCKGSLPLELQEELAEWKRDEELWEAGMLAWGEADMREEGSAPAWE